MAVRKAVLVHIARQKQAKLIKKYEKLFDKCLRENFSLEDDVRVDCEFLDDVVANELKKRFKKAGWEIKFGYTEGTDQYSATIS